jgi:hypothetical protein
VNDLSCKILRNKYLGDAGFYQSKGEDGSWFWQELCRIKKCVVGMVKRFSSSEMCGFQSASRMCCLLRYIVVVNKIELWL